MGILEQKKIVLLNYPLGLSLLKYRNVWVFWNKKKSGSNRYSPLNSSIDNHWSGSWEYLNIGVLNSGFVPPPPDIICIYMAQDPS